MARCEDCGREMTEAAAQDSLAELGYIQCDVCPDEDRAEYENDGQPDEMQEWHDFDPDC